MNVTLNLEENPQIKLMIYNPNIRSRNAPHGFTLIELLVVIAIVSILLTASASLFRNITTSQGPNVVAEALASQLERARVYAVANRTYVWVRVGPVSEAPNDLVISTYESPDGSNRPAAAVRGWNTPRFENVKVTSNIVASFTRPVVPAAGRVDGGAWMLFDPSGKLELFEDATVPTELSLRNPPPVVVGPVSVAEFGIRGTRGGNLVAANEEDVAAVQISGLTGHTIVYSR